MTPTFFFYDLETSGLSPREDRIMQFAGQRTDLDLNPLGPPVNLKVKLPDDTLPSPHAILVTGITPQSTQQDGLTEAELARYLTEEIFTPGTIAVGYNSIRFDDEFLRHFFWRNFYDPYEWQWLDGRSRWDLLDVVRLTRALRPEGINWPVTPDGHATNRLELITKLNGIEHTHAHDALSDVEALIDVTRLIKQHQPQLFDYLFDLRHKKKVQKLINLTNPKPFIYASGRYGAQFNKTTVAYPLTTSRNGNLLVFDLRYNLDDLLAQRAAAQSTSSHSATTQSSPAASGPSQSASSPDSNATAQPPHSDTFFPIVKELCFNKCPAVAPLGVLSQNDGWQKIGLTPELIQQNLRSLLAHPDFAERLHTQYEQRPEWPPAVDPESALYDSFLPEPDRIRVEAVRNADATKLADFHPSFVDERLPGLLLHYKARNFPSALSDHEHQLWEEYRLARLNRQSPKFLAALTECQKTNPDPYLLEELQLWYQSLAATDY